jgi:hypothetical protein
LFSNLVKSSGGFEEQISPTSKMDFSTALTPAFIYVLALAEGIAANENTLAALSLSKSVSMENQEKYRSRLSLADY